MTSKIKPMRRTEIILVFAAKRPFYILKKLDDGKYPHSLLDIKHLAGCHKTHPTQKPEELYRWLLERYCPAGGTVLDPTAGSFNACFVAKELGLKAIGMEKDHGFFYKALVRLLKLRSGDVIEHV
jgi:DNA modification methylase